MTSEINWLLGQNEIGSERDSEDARFVKAANRLVDNILVPGGVTDSRVLQSIRDTPRHKFVRPDQQDKAYFDMSLPIGDKQTISSPYIVAVMTEALETKPTDRVLEIGTGSGYQAAVLSPLVEDVYTIEIVEPLGLKSAKLLESIGYKNIHTKIGDGFKGWEEHAPFDKIVVTCSPEKVPDPLKEQLAEGGLMVIPVGERYQQTLYLLRKTDGELVQEALRPTLFVPMTGAAEDSRQTQPDPLHPVIVNGDFEEKLVAEEHVPGWYYQFAMKVVAADDAPTGKHVVQFQNDEADRPGLLLQGMPMDGRKIRRVKLGAWAKPQGVRSGRNPQDVPAVVIQFFDADRKRLTYSFLGPYRGTHDWRREERQFVVPPNTREAIISIGLFGATGTVSFDAITLEVTKRTD